MKKHIAILAGAVVVLAVGGTFLWGFAGGYGLHVLLHRDLKWPEVSTSDVRLSRAMRLALQPVPPLVHSGELRWTQAAPGLQVAELTVLLADGEAIDAFELVRIDPKAYVFSAHVQSARKWTIFDWQRQLPAAAVIVNGSFFAPGRGPDTPLISDGHYLGPPVYDATAGAFTADDAGAAVVDLRDGSGWQKAFQGRRNAMVAYPLLIGTDGQTHVTRPGRWLANRSFVAEDQDGFIVIGSTREAFFSLDREAAFLLASPLRLKVALNLDGGPVACQSVRAGRIHRVHIARWEAQVDGDRARLLDWAVGESDMPIVLAATLRTGN